MSFAHIVYRYINPSQIRLIRTRFLKRLTVFQSSRGVKLVILYASTVTSWWFFRMAGNVLQTNAINCGKLQWQQHFNTCFVIAEKWFSRTGSLKAPALSCKNLSIHSHGNSMALSRRFSEGNKFPIFKHLNFWWSKHRIFRLSGGGILAIEINHQTKNFRT